MQNDAVGSDLSGTVAGLGNGANGVYVQNGAANAVVADTPAVSGNGANGVLIDGAGTNGAVVRGNYVGTDGTGTAKLANAADGVLVSGGAANNTVGGTAAGAINLISGNGGNGVEIMGSGSTGDVVLGNKIGTDINGTAKLGNAGGGVKIDGGAKNDAVGGTATGAGNLISGNGGNGVEIAGASGIAVLGNLIGTGIHGTASLGNAGDGVKISGGSADNTVGGPTFAALNLISANGGNGVEIAGSGATGNAVLGSRIGTDIKATKARGNGLAGVLVSGGAADNSVGGVGAGDLIAGNAGPGVEITGTGSSGTVVFGNLIGTNGPAALANSVGVLILGGATANSVGGTVSGSRNVISGNTTDGVELSGAGTSGNVVIDNSIGTDGTGRSAVGNGRDGVRIDAGATANTVGGTAMFEANQIAFNAKGVVVVGAATTGDAVLGNVILRNAGLGIDLGDDGFTANGVNPRSFPNDGQNAPITTSFAGGVATGSLTSQPNHTYRIEFFANDPSPTPYQGQTFLGFVNVTTGANGVGRYSKQLTIPAGTVVTATATDITAGASFGDTSEFA